MSTRAPYTINYTDGRNFTVLPNTTNTSETDIVFFGHGTEIYGEVLNENLLHILENFANTTAPLNPTEGQLWFDRSKSILNIRTNNIWNPVGVSFNTTTPTTTTLGSLWFDSSDNKLKMWNGTIWEPVKSDITTETNARIAADNALTNRININENLLHILENFANTTTETDARIAADNALTNRINIQTSMKNKIINGGMRIAQRGFSAIASTLQSAIFLMDTWLFTKLYTNANLTISRDIDVPIFSSAGETFQYSTKIVVNTIDNAPDSLSYIAYATAIEGQIFAPLFGKAMTLSFWVKSSKVGTYCATFRNLGYTRSYVSEYQINVANTWEKKIINLTSTTIGNWNLDIDVGLTVTFTLMSGSAYNTTAINSWVSENKIKTNNQINFADTVGATINFTGVQLEAGSIATGFDFRPLQIELQLCQRYYEKSYSLDVTPGTPDPAPTPALQGFTILHKTTATAAFGGAVVKFRFNTEKRVTPSITLYARRTGTPNAVSINKTGFWELEFDSSLFYPTSSTKEGYLHNFGGTDLVNEGEVATFYWAVSAELINN